ARSCVYHAHAPPGATRSTRRPRRPPDALRRVEAGRGAAGGVVCGCGATRGDRASDTRLRIGPLQRGPRRDARTRAVSPRAAWGRRGHHARMGPRVPPAPPRRRRAGAKRSGLRAAIGAGRRGGDRRVVARRRRELAMAARCLTEPRRRPEALLAVATLALLCFYYFARADAVGVYSRPRGWF